jgi:hypothetical protein
MKASNEANKGLRDTVSERSLAAQRRGDRPVAQAKLQRRQATRNLHRGEPAATPVKSGPNAANKGGAGSSGKTGSGRSKGSGPTARSIGHRNGNNGNRNNGGGKPGKVNKPGKAGKGGGTKATGSKAVKPGVDPDLAAAQRSVGLELDPQLSELMRQMTEAKVRLQQEKDSINQTQGKTSDNLKTIYSGLDQYLNANQANTGTGFDAAAGATKSGFDQLISSLGQQGQQAVGNANAEQARLGIQGAPGVDTSGITRDQALLQGLAGINSQSAQAGIQSGKASTNGLMDMLQGNAQTSGAEHQNSALRAALDQIMGAEQDFNTQNFELSGRYGDIAGSRGAKIQEMLDTIKQAKFEQQMELSQQAFNNTLAQNKFGLDQASLVSQNKSRKAQTRLEKAKLDLDRQKAAQDAADKAADRKLRAEQAAAKAAGTDGSGSFNPKGFSGAVELIHRAQPNQFQANKLETIIRKIRITPSVDPGNYDSIARQVDFGRKLLKQYGIDSVANRKILSDAMSAYHGKYGGS